VGSGTRWDRSPERALSRLSGESSLRGAVCRQDRISWLQLIVASGTLGMSSHYVPHHLVVVLDCSPDLHPVLILPHNRDNRLNRTVSLPPLVFPTAPRLSPTVRRTGRGAPRTSRVRSSRRRASYLAGRIGEESHPERRSRLPLPLRLRQDRTLRPRVVGEDMPPHRIGTVLRFRLLSPRAVCEGPHRRLTQRIRRSRTPRPLCQMSRSDWRRATWGMARTGTGATDTRPQRQRRLGDGRGA
jgi:hypothetical protein